MQHHKIQIFKHYPIGFTPIFFTQIFFNFSFYGFKSLFLLYAIELLSLKEYDAIAFFSAFMSLTYATSLIGGTLADKLIGSRNSLLIGGSVCCVAILLLIIQPHTTIYLGMALLSVGLGCYKPNFSTMLSMLYEDTQDPHKDNAFTTLYIAMNIGSFMGPLASSLISRIYGWQSGLMMILISFLSGTLLFFEQTKSIKLVRTNFKKNDIAKSLFILSIVTFLIYYLFKSEVYFHKLMGFIIGASIIGLGYFVYKANPQERQKLSKAIYYVILFTLFCALYEQCGSSLLLFFENFVDREVFNIVFPSSSLLSLNPLLVLLLGILIPFVATKLSNKKVVLEGFTKFAIGFFLISLSFGILFLAADLRHNPISILWMLFAIILQTIGELLIVPVGFSNISKLVPQRYMGFMMGLWLMAISYGHYLAGIIANYSLNTSEGKFIYSLENFSQFFIKLSIFPFIIAAFLAIFIIRRKFKKNNNKPILKNA